jgi:hypothetical protein
MSDEKAKCRWCGETLAEHLDQIDPSGPFPRMPCSGLKSSFMARPACDHKFVDSKRCLKCGWSPSDEP